MIARLLGAKAKFYIPFEQLSNDSLVAQELLFHIFQDFQQKYPVGIHIAANHKGHVVG